MGIGLYLAKAYVATIRPYGLRGGVRHMWDFAERVYPLDEEFRLGTAATTAMIVGAGALVGAEYWTIRRFARLPPTISGAACGLTGWLIGHDTFRRGPEPNALGPASKWIQDGVTLALLAR